MRTIIKDAIVANNGTYSAGFTTEPWAINFGAFFPPMDNGVIGLELTLDNTNYYPVLDPADGDDVVLCASGSDPGFVDFSKFVSFVPDNVNYKLRFTCAAQSSGEVKIRVLMRG